MRPQEEYKRRDLHFRRRSLPLVLLLRGIFLSSELFERLSKALYGLQHLQPLHVGERALKVRKMLVCAAVHVPVY